MQVGNYTFTTTVTVDTHGPTAVGSFVVLSQPAAMPPPADGGTDSGSGGSGIPASLLQPPPPPDLLPPGTVLVMLQVQAGMCGS